jgi:hypothetical protein
VKYLLSSLGLCVLVLIHAVKTVIISVPQIIEGRSISHLFNSNQLHVWADENIDKKSWETLHHWILPVMKIAINGIASFLYAVKWSAHLRICAEISPKINPGVKCEPPIVLFPDPNGVPLSIMQVLMQRLSRCRPTHTFLRPEVEQAGWMSTNLRRWMDDQYYHHNTTKINKKILLIFSFSVLPTTKKAIRGQKYSWKSKLIG